MYSPRNPKPTYHTMRTRTNKSGFISQHNIYVTHFGASKEPMEIQNPHFGSDGQKLTGSYYNY